MHLTHQKSNTYTFIIHRQTNVHTRVMRGTLVYSQVTVWYLAHLPLFWAPSLDRESEPEPVKQRVWAWTCETESLSLNLWNRESEPEPVTQPPELRLRLRLGNGVHALRGKCSCWNFWWIIGFSCVNKCDSDACKGVGRRDWVVGQKAKWRMALVEVDTLLK